jgi:preprotein translocase subunit YajC
MFISEAFAQSGGGGGAGAFGGLGGLLPIVLIFVVFWFLLIRPQQKRMKEHKSMIATLKRGDKIVTGGGIIGTVTKVIDDSEVQVEIAKDVRVRISRSTIQAVVGKPQPAAPPPPGGGEPKKPGLLGGLGGLGGLFGKR